MLGDFVTRILVLLLGYAYPAFECFRTLEAKEVTMQQLRFWCQYWVIVGFFTVIESFTDALASWVPMYSEGKLTFLIYLWYPQTKGTCFIYERLLEPYLLRHEPEFEEKVQVLMAKAADLLMFYLKNFTDKGQSMVLDVLQYVMSQPSRLTERIGTGQANGPAISYGEPEPVDFPHNDSHAHRKRDGVSKRRK